MTPTTLDQLAQTYDAFLIDQFGVLLHGDGAYPYAPAALAQLARVGKPILLLSNSGKRAAANEARLTRLGFARDSYLGVLSSGEAAYSAFSRKFAAGIMVQPKLWVHSRDDDRTASDGLPFEVVDAADQADLLLLAGSQGDRLSLDDYAFLLAAAARRAVPMVCTNPDLEMLTGVGKRFGAGAIAALYAKMGGPVDYIGKPYPLIYQEAALRLPGIPAARILCIGDSPAHDICGGKAAGHATALVHKGLHANLSLSALHDLCVAEGATPDALLDRFQFEPEVR